MGLGPFGKGLWAMVLFRGPRLNSSKMEMSHRHRRCCRSCEKDNIIVMWSDNSALSTLIIQQCSVCLACSCICMCLCVQLPFPFSPHSANSQKRKHGDTFGIFASFNFFVMKGSKLGYTQSICVYVFWNERSFPAWTWFCVFGSVFRCPQVHSVSKVFLNISFYITHRQ